MTSTNPNNQHAFRVTIALCVRVVMSLLCTMQHGGLQNQNLTTLCAFSHKGSHFECHKTHTLSLRRLWKGGDLGGGAPIGRPLFLRKPRGGFPHLAHGIKIRAPNDVFSNGAIGVFVAVNGTRTKKSGRKISRVSQLFALSEATQQSAAFTTTVSTQQSVTLSSS